MSHCDGQKTDKTNMNDPVVPFLHFGVIILFESYVVLQSQFLFYLVAHRETVEEECHPSISAAKFDTSSGQTSSLQANL